MTQDEIIEMARQAGFSETEGLFRTLYISAPSDIQAFAKLVAAKEREACAKVCDNKDEIWRKAGLWNVTNEYRECAAAIRARGEA